MKEFLYLFRGGAPRPNQSPEDMQKHMQKWQTWIEQLGKQGKYKAGDPLEADGKVVRAPNKMVTDGPFAESKENVGGYLIVTAGDLAAATEIAKDCPIFENGGHVEVRPIAKM
jgi:hypothetical protein